MCNVPLTTAGENGPTSLPSEKARKERGKLVQAVADEFVAAFVEAAGLKAHVTIYMHVIKCHLSQFVELYGNLMDYSAQGSEHCHVLTKYAMKYQTNKKTDQRVEQALRAVAFFMHYEKIYPSTKGMGTKRNRSALREEEDARYYERLQEVMETAKECADAAAADATPVEIEEVWDDDGDDFDPEERCECGAGDDDDDDADAADDLLIG